MPGHDFCVPRSPVSEPSLICLEMKGDSLHSRLQSCCAKSKIILTKKAMGEKTTVENQFLQLGWVLISSTSSRKEKGKPATVYITVQYIENTLLMAAVKSFGPLLSLSIFHSPFPLFLQPFFPSQHLLTWANFPFTLPYFWNDGFMLPRGPFN